MFKTIFAVFVGLVLASHVKAQVPIIYAQSADITLQVGQTASLAVNVTSNLPVTFEWFANSRLIPDAIAQAYTTPAVTLADNGTIYICTVINSDGAVNSQPMILNVVNPSTYSMVLNPAIQNVRLGGPPVTLTLGVTNTSGQIISLGCQTTVPNSVCLLSGNEILSGDVTVSVLTGKSSYVPSAPTGSLWLLVILTAAVVLFVRPKCAIKLALVPALMLGGCASVRTPPAFTSQTFVVTVKGNLPGAIPQQATASLVAQN